jgi:hypothetical protein
MDKRTLTEALENLPPDWFKLSPQAKAEFERMQKAHEDSQNSMWCLCPHMLKCDYLKRGEYCK